jgi:hypothetical protein
MEFLLIFGGSLVLMMLLGGDRAKARGAVVAGQRVREELSAVYGGPHDYAQVSPSGFPDADQAYYQAATSELQGLGMRHLTDLEDLTLSRVYPTNRTFLRVFVDDAGLIRAVVYHMRPRGGMVALLQLVHVLPRHIRVIELVSEIPEGKFLSTSNTAGIDRLQHAPAVEIERLATSTSVRAVVERHRERVAGRLRQHPEYSPVEMGSYESVMASVQRNNVVMARHRAQMKGLSRDELETIAGRPLTATDEEFLREIQGRSRDSDR